MINYKCKRCNFTSKYYNDLYRHINKRKICIKNLEAYSYSDEELFKLSLIPYFDNLQNIDINLLKNINNNIVNKIKFLEILKNIDKQKLKECIFCNKKFTKVIDLKNHMILECLSLDSQNNNVMLNNNSNNNINSNNTNNININNLTINNLNPPISFDKDWDVSHLSIAEKEALLLSMYQYIKTLDSILKNKNNQNVLIDKDSNSGLVYQNNNIEKMNINDIFNKSFDKIYSSLNNFCEDIKNDNIYKLDPNLIKEKKVMIKDKYEDYQENNIIKKNVNNLINNSFDKVKEQTNEIFKNIDDNNKLLNY